MKIVLNIYKSILFGKLRPLLKENKSNEKFSKLLHPSFKIDTNDPKKFSDILLEKLRDDPKFNEDDEYMVEIKDNEINLTPANDDILKPLINIDIPAPFNDKTEYYHLLITSEHKRIIKQLNKVVPSLSSLKQAKYEIDSVLGKFKYFLRSTHRIIKELGYKGELPYNNPPDDQQELERVNTGYIHTILETTLIELYLEVQIFFPSYIKGKALTKNDIYNQVLGIISPAQSAGSLSLHLNKLDVEKFINKRSYSLQEATWLIEETKESILSFPSIGISGHEVSIRKDNFYKSIEQLENLIYLYEIEKIIDRPKQSDLTDRSFTEPIVENAQNNLLEKLERCKFPNKKLETLLNRKEQLQFIYTKIKISEDGFHDSIPRKILQWLEIQIDYWNANLSIDSKILRGYDLPKIPSSLSVPELGYLFNALIAEGVFSPRHKTHFYKIINSVFSAKMSKSPSEHSLKNKPATLGSKSLQKMEDIFIHLRQRVIKDIENF